MASILKRKLKRGIRYYIAYRIKNLDGTKKQLRYYCKNEEEANALLSIISECERDGREYREETWYNYINTAHQESISVAELVDRYIHHRSYVRNWKARTLTLAQMYARNYINPFIGSAPISDINTIFIQRFYDDLPNHKAAYGNHKSDPGNISARTVHEVNKILRPAFAYAERIGLIGLNPIRNIELPEVISKEREILPKENLKYILNDYTNETLTLAERVMFMATLRTGELTGLTWDSVIENGDRVTLIIDKELARVDRESLANTNTKVFFEFPSIKPNSTSVVILTTPKTKTSERRYVAPPFLSKQIMEHKYKQDALKKELGEAYSDFNLVFAQENGWPHANGTLSNAFKKNLKINNIKKVDLLSMRHSGATEKMELAKNPRTVPQELGHSKMDLTLNTYTHNNVADMIDTGEKLEKEFFEEIYKTEKT